jgi:protein-S-isoprenylcysteine O-methyltransferase Ste14
MRSVKIPALELKIPPVLLTMIFVLLIWVIARQLPLVFIPAGIRLVLAAGLLIAGACVALAAVVSFRRAKTTLNPMLPGNCSCLVTSGIFGITRNPMYLGLFLLLLAWALFLSSLYSLAVCAGFVMYMNRLQIQPEEKALESVFGQGYLDYKSRVRRWV